MKNRAALVTGGGGGIGSQTALRLGQLGASVLVADMSEPAVSRTVQRLEQAGISCLGKQADASKEREASELAAACLAQWGRLDILINCAGIYRDCLVEDMTAAQWQQTLDINLNSVFYTCRAALPAMKAQSYGKIVNLTSQAGIQGSLLHAHYAASKAGIIGFSCSLAREVAADGIHVNCVAPGIIATGMVEDILKKRGDYFLSNIPLGRFGTPDEAAKVIAFLASDDASYMTGQTINVTGGWLMHS